MSEQATPRRIRRLRGFRSLSVAGFKSIGDPLSIAIKPLTVIAGVNSSGKSSFMQPFLMLKQTLESSFDPGPLRLYGPNVRLTEWGQALSRQKARSSTTRELRIGMQVSGRSLENTYYWNLNQGLRLASTDYSGSGVRQKHTFIEGMSHQNVVDQLTDKMRTRLSNYTNALAASSEDDIEDPDSLDDSPKIEYDLSVLRRQVFMSVSAKLLENGKAQGLEIPFDFDNFSTRDAMQALSAIIHVPGLRGNPERIYESSVIGRNYAGTFDRYVASVVNSWSRSGETGEEKLLTLGSTMRRLGLTWKIEARQVNDVQVELRVGRMPKPQQGGAQDLVNIADVGFGVSQTLPIVVALLSARQGQLVYLEQPEIHLHPRAQVALGEVFVEAARRGVILLVETHSSLILRSIQTAVARRQIHPEDVGLNWFSRDPSSGFSRVDVASVGASGEFGDWPVDFDEVAENADWDYLTSVEEAVVDAE